MINVRITKKIEQISTRLKPNPDKSNTWLKK